MAGRTITNNIRNVRITFPRLALVLACPALLCTTRAQATFSIVAVDTVNQWVGSAGASCIAGAQIIEGAVEGVGAINTQALWNADNQANADSLMRAGIAPDSIMAWLAANDAADDGFDAGDRQVGAVTLAGPGASAARTGASTIFWAGHRTGLTYSVQGNILLDSTIVEMMEDAYLTTPGQLEDKLMAALQAAKVPGADTRCFPQNKSSISAYIRVIRPGDGSQSYLYLVVPNTTFSTDPIDLLQGQFDAWREAQVASAGLSSMTVAPGGVPASGTDTAWITVTARNSLNLPPTFGSVVTLEHTGTGTLLPVQSSGNGVYSAAVISGTAVEADTFTAFVEGGQVTTELPTPAILHYFLCGDVNVDGNHTSADIIQLVNHVFKSGPPPAPVPGSGDVNRSGTLTSADVIYLVNFIFKSGAPPCQ